VAEQRTIDDEPPELLQSILSDKDEASTRDDDEGAIADTNLSEAQKDIMAVAMMATAIATTVQNPSSTPAKMVAFYHAAMYSPAISTLQNAMKKGFLPPFTGLSEATLKKFPPPLEATTMGHLDNRRKNIQSTKRKAPVEEDQDGFPEQPTDNRRTNLCILATTEPRNIVYSDQTGTASASIRKRQQLSFDSLRL
jgi:hypothetical protein